MRRRSGDLEAEILAALWAAPEPLTPGQVREALGTGLAYTTVQTILTRLHDKGTVRREPSGRAHAYAPLLDEAGLAARRMRSTLDAGSDQEAVLSRFVGSLTPEQERTLARLLRGGPRRGPDGADGEVR